MTSYNSYIIAIILLFMTGCQSSKIQTSWTLFKPASETMKKVLILCSAENKEEKERIERSIAYELIKYAVHVNISNDIFNSNEIQKMSKDEFSQKLDELSYTSIIIISIRNKDIDSSSYFFSQRAIHSNLEKNKIIKNISDDYILDTDIYCLQNDKLIYSAQIENYKPLNKDILPNNFLKTIIKELKEKNLLI